MPLACIDIGSNTTRLLVAEPEEGGLRELAAERVYTRIGRSLRRTGEVPEDKIAETAVVAGRQARRARDLGAEHVAIVATAAIRRAANRDRLAAAVEAAAGARLRVLSDEEEARLAFLGASHAAGPVAGRLAVVDVGGGSSEIAVGTLDGGVEWADSLPIGSGLLADAHLHADPPAAAELEAVRAQARGAFEGLRAPAVESAVACGGSATSLRRLAGEVLDRESLARSIALLAGSPVADVAARFELDPERVRLLPAGVLVLEAVSERLGCPLRIVGGGIREGVIRELAAARR